MRIKLQFKDNIAHAQAFSNDRRDRSYLATNEREFVSRETLKAELEEQILAVAQDGMNHYIDRVQRQSYTVSQGEG